MKNKSHSDTRLAFGMKLREIRKSKGFTQQKLAYLADMDASSINRIELGKSNTSLNNLFAMCEALDIEVRELFEFSSKKKKG